MPKIRLTAAAPNISALPAGTITHAMVSAPVDRRARKDARRIRVPVQAVERVYERQAG